jgi:hypothetical protein
MVRSIDLVTELIAQGKSIREMAKMFNISPTPMRMWMKQRGLFSKQSNPRRWSDLDLKLAITNSFTMAQVLRTLGLSVRPGNYDTIKKRVYKLGLDTKHFTGKSHGTSISPRRLKHNEVFCTNSSCNRGNVKRRIIKEELIPYLCEICGQDGYWNHAPLVLILDHRNGVNNDHRIENLRFLCPNCNSQQITFCRK